MILERLVPLTYKEYGGWNCIGEVKEYFLATEMDCEGRINNVVHALSKKVWKVRE